jgi:hypothetical protein
MFPPNFDPGFNEAVILRILADQQLLMDEQRKANEVVAFLSAVARIRENADQRIAAGLPIDPFPVPPAHYVPPPAPPVPPPAPKRTVIQPKNQFGIYPGAGDDNPNNFILPNPHTPGTWVRKVVQITPFGNSHYWVDHL